MGASLMRLREYCATEDNAAVGAIIDRFANELMTATINSHVSPLTINH
jgi:hypothetical protein